MDAWEPLTSRLRLCGPEETVHMIRQTPSVVFEGAQGVLLDQDYGFHPHTTWSDCTPKGALALLAGADPRIHRLGVIRSYMVRHGIGPFPTWDPGYDEAVPELHNEEDGWQGPVRRGEVGARDIGSAAEP